MSTVYFTKETTPENVVKLFNLLNKDLPGKVACKVHSGEKGIRIFASRILETNYRTCKRCRC